MCLKLFLLLVVLGCIHSVYSCCKAEWDYDNPADWGQHYPQCDGNAQSPIGLKISTSYFQKRRPIEFVNYQTEFSDCRQHTQQTTTTTTPMPTAARGGASNMQYVVQSLPSQGSSCLTLKNNGHTITADIPNTKDGKRPTIRGGPLDAVYEAQTFHFHWGAEYIKGSEHVINHRAFDVEMHIVHKNTNYTDMSEAMQHCDGIVVLAIFLEIDDHPEYYPGLTKIFEKLPEVIQYESQAEVEGDISLADLMGDIDLRRFYLYKGSLTTPPCSEAVTWIVYDDYLIVSKKLISKFWDILNKDGEEYINNRPLQTRNQREVFYENNHHDIILPFPHYAP